MMKIHDVLLAKVMNGKSMFYPELINRFKSSEKILNASKSEIELCLKRQALKGHSREILSFLSEVEKFQEDRKQFVAKYNEEAKEITKLGAKIITISEKDYPDQLRKIIDPPLVLYVKGDINFDYNKSIAIVGTRNMSSYAFEKTIQITRELSREGFCVISGLARGTDGIAHRAVINVNAKTISVLALGLKYIYPPEHKILSEEIVDHDGALISEVFNIEGRFNKNPQEFKRRNRIISGLSRAILIVEGSEKSGSLSQYNHARRQQKQIFTLKTESKYECADLPKKIKTDGYPEIDSARDILNYFEKNDNSQKQLLLF